MGRRASRLGWMVAAALGAGWLFSDSNEKPSAPTAPPPIVLQPQRKPVAGPLLPAPKHKEVPPPAEAREQEKVHLVTTARVRVRSSPSISASIVTTLAAATSVVSIERRGEWHAIEAGLVSGWIRGDLLAPPQPTRQKRPAPPKPREPAPVVRALPAPPREDRSGQPVREPYVGTCDCPYDRMRNGRRCGGNSAYSRPGGRNPLCYF